MLSLPSYTLRVEGILKPPVCHDLHWDCFFRVIIQKKSLKMAHFWLFLSQHSVSKYFCVEQRMSHLLIIIRHTTKFFQQKSTKGIFHKDAWWHYCHRNCLIFILIDSSWIVHQKIFYWTFSFFTTHICSSLCS